MKPINILSVTPSFFLVVRSYASPSEASSQFNIMVDGTPRKYYMLGGKGGVGKTSCAASLAVKFASHGHPTIVVSTDPAHSLSDSFDQVVKFASELSYFLLLVIKKYIWLLGKC